MEDIEKILNKLLKPAESSKVPASSGESTAAVLILLVKENDEWSIVYTRRTNGVRTHQGEVSFPGGGYEKQDESFCQTALRETREEIGVDPNCIKILGGLDPTKTISNFLVYPFVGILTCQMEFTINPDEVERVFLIPMKWLMDQSNFYEREHKADQQVFRRVIHYKDYDGEHLWGLTARITQEVLALLK
jgi:8-oxo-dGTP pyrophosphatase MutT (NUDIX family)